MLWSNQKRFVKETKEKYPPGTTVILDLMDDPQAPAPGTRGTVRYVDDAGQIHVAWEGGGSLALLPGMDAFHKEVVA